MSNAVRAAHAAYALDLDDAEWLEQLAGLIGPLLDRGRGLVAFRWRHTLEKGVQPDEMTVNGGKPGDAQMLRELLANLDRRRAYLAYGAPYGYRSLSEIAQDHPTLTDLTDDRDMQRLAHDRQVLDFEMLRVDEANGRGWMFSVLRPDMGGLAEPRRELWQRVGAHIAAGARLRLRLDDVDLDGAAAVFDGATSRLAVNDRGLEPTDRRSRLLQLIEARRDAERLADTDPQKAIDRWEGLVDGRWSLLDIVDTDGRSYTVLRENPLDVRSTMALSERERQVAYLVGRGHHVKLVAYEMGLTPSTVRSQLRSALRKLNLDDRTGLHRLVATVANPEPTTELDDLGVLALAESPLRIPDALSDAEGEVATLVYEGLSNRDIADRRGTAPRTVANQLASIYRKLGVDSREDLVRRLTSSGRQGSPGPSLPSVGLQ
ncbi:MAG: helix-turn-helix transcriptional regulator [Myxococcota bacterium]